MIKLFLFPVLAAFAILGCSSGDDMPCETCGGEYTVGSCNASHYGSVNINGQIWMKKNWGCYAPGSKCYNNDPANCDKYGRLYDWSTAMGISSSYNNNYYNPSSSTKHQGICPSGWHIPSDAEWDALTNYVGTNAGTKLKATSGWNSHSGVPSGSDTYGFAALPGGFGSSDGFFSIAGYDGNWWSATEGNAYNAYNRYMYYYYEGVYRYNYDKSYLQSVRCLQDSP